MSKPSQAPKTPPPAAAKSETIKAVTVFKISRLETEAFELTIVDGKVTEMKSISRCPDIQQITVGNASSKLWEYGRTQRAKDYKSET